MQWLKISSCHHQRQEWDVRSRASLQKSWWSWHLPQGADQVQRACSEHLQWKQKSDQYHWRLDFKTKLAQPLRDIQAKFGGNSHHFEARSEICAWPERKVWAEWWSSCTLRGNPDDWQIFQETATRQVCIQLHQEPYTVTRNSFRVRDESTWVNRDIQAWHEDATICKAVPSFTASFVWFDLPLQPGERRPL